MEGIRPSSSESFAREVSKPVTSHSVKDAKKEGSVGLVKIGPQATEAKYLKITPEKIYSPLLDYAIKSWRGEKAKRSFMPIAVKFNVETTTDKKQKTPELVSLVYGRAMLTFKRSEFGDLLKHYGESELSSFAKRRFNQIAWQYYDPKNIIALSLQARSEISPDKAVGFTQLGKLQGLAERAYKFVNLGQLKFHNPVLSGSDKKALQTIRDKAWSEVHTLRSNGKNEKTVQKAGKIAVLWSQVKLRILGPLNRFLPLHTVTWIAKYALTGAAMTVTFSAYSAVKLFGKISSCARKTLFPPREKTTESVIEADTYTL